MARVTVSRTALDEKIHAEQLTGIGATDSAAILGVSPYSSAYKVWERLTGQGEAPVAEVPVHWAIGSELEAFVARLYTERTGHRVRRSWTHHRHRVHEWMVCHLDYRVLGTRRLLEIKTALRKSDDWGELGTDRIPVHYWIQCQHEMAVTGYDWVDVPVLFLNSLDFGIYTVERDKDYIASLIEALAEFYENYVVTRQPPPVDGSEDARRYMAKRWPKDDGLVLPATAEQAEIVERYRRAELNVTQTTQERDRLKNRIIEIIGANSGLRGGDFEVTYKQVKEGKPETNWGGVAAALTTIIERLPEAVQRAIVEDELKLPGVPLKDAMEALIGLYTGPGRKAYRRFEFRDRKEQE